ncbi:MAG TPA: sugar phosphate isomerase/epimerase family protein, partial [Lacipirellulaceae bacterium]|nr:sugar phosphate isomerase/epimerase family protein [Lacipirellulaceae bacterium]
AADGGAQPQRTYAAFIKFLQPLGYDELADQIAALGFQGVEATVRTADGYIKPAEAAQELPKFQRALARRGLEITILTTDFLGVDQPHVESTLRAAADAGVGRYRLGFYRYDLGRPIEPQLDEIKPAIDALAALNRRVGIGAVYQNHCGADFVGATFWDLHRLLADVEPGEVGCVYDLRHAVVEAGEAWPMLYGLIKPHVTAASVKDFAWGDGKSQHVPLGEGRTPRKFYTDLAKSDFAGPISLHVEYLKQDHPVPEHLAALKRDLATLRKWMDG